MSVVNPVPFWLLFHGLAVFIKFGKFLLIISHIFSPALFSSPSRTPITCLLLSLWDLQTSESVHVPSLFFFLSLRPHHLTWPTFKPLVLLSAKICCVFLWWTFCSSYGTFQLQNFFFLKIISLFKIFFFCECIVVIHLFFYFFICGFFTSQVYLK